MNFKPSKFTWGDSVQVKESAPTIYRPGDYGSVCSINEVTSRESAKKYQCLANTYLYIVEYSDGTSQSIPEWYLEPWSSTK